MWVALHLKDDKREKIARGGCLGTGAYYLSPHSFGQNRLTQAYRSTREAGKYGEKRSSCVDIDIDKGIDIDIGIGIDKDADIDTEISQVHTSYSLYTLINTCGKKMGMEQNWR